jgi:TRAP-type C4-dicarboxylate transport system permease small subunit
MVDVRGRVGAGLAAVRTVGVLIFAAPVIWYSVFDGRMNMARGFLGRSLDRTAEMIPVSMIWFTSAVPIAFVIIVVHALAALAMHLAGEEQVADLTTKENPT